MKAKFPKKRQSAYQHAYLGKMNNTETTTRDFGIQSVPSIWLIGPDGRVLARDLSGEKIGEAVRKALSKSQSKTP